MAEPFLKFYPRDWTSDARLNRCRLASREVWKRMLILMREAEPFGFFVGHAGEPIPIEWFAREVNASTREIRQCMKDLEENGVFSRDSSDRIFSRRMLRDKARQEQARINARNGGNPVLRRDPNNLNRETPVNRRTHDPVNQDEPIRITTAIARDRDPEARDTDSLRSSALEFGDWPKDNDGLRRLALLFLGAFGNCFDPDKASRHVPAYMQVLAQMRTRRATIAAAWQACNDARDANNGKPLFSASVRTAMSFLGAPTLSSTPPVVTPETDDYIARLEEQERARRAKRGVA